jgi:acid phosphatase type 7
VPSGAALAAIILLATLAPIWAAPSSASAAPKIVAAAGDVSPAQARDDDDRVAAMIRSKIRPDALLVIGDAQYEDGTLEEYRTRYAQSFGVRALADITYPVPGNHEYDVGPGESSADPAAGYYEYFRRHAAVDPNGVARHAGYYSYRLGRWHVAAVNSQDGFDPLGKQVRWLERDLANSHGRCELAYWHHPRWSSGIEHGGYETMQPFWSAAVNAGVDVVLSAHEHLYERFSRLDARGHPVSDRHRGPGARLFVVGTGGKGGNEGFGAPEDGSQVRWPAHGSASVFGALRLRLAKRSYSWKMLDVSGAVVDEGGPVSCH